MIECTECGSTDLRKKGIRNGLQRYRCNHCGAWTSEREYVALYPKSGRIVGFAGSTISIGKCGLDDPIIIPLGDCLDYSPLILDSSAYPVIVGADAHVPYHDAQAIRIFINRAKSIGAKTVILNGDWLDCYQLSRFSRDPNMRDIVGEIAMLKTILGIIRDELPDARIIYKFGNHEDRFDAYIMANAKELYGLKSIHLDELAELGLKELKIEVVRDKRIIRIGHLNVIHGHEYPGGMSAPVNPARGLYLKAKKSALEGHFHQSSEHTETAINDDVVTDWSIGCLCGLHPLYMPLNKWNHGFAEIMEEDGFFIVRNRKIIGGRLL